MTTETTTDVFTILAAHAQRTEERQRPAAESLRAARDAGAFALRTPPAYGGAGAGAETVAARLAEWGRACPSTAWIAGTCATAKTLAATLFTGPAGAEIFADPDALACGSGRPGARGERRPDGVLVNGRWPAVSGCEDAAWASLAVLVDGTFHLAVVPMGNLTIEPTWQMAGMRGTGSHTLVAENVLVRADRIAPLDMRNSSDRLLFGITVLGPVVGAARGALDVIGAMFASDRAPFMTAYTRMGESPGARQWLAEATHLVDRAGRTMTEVARAADSGAATTPADGVRLHMDLADAGRDCRAALERMLDLHGSAGFADSNPLQRYWRDVAVGSRHPHLNPYLAVENYGRTVAGEA
ncbi:acyl-CoA dehydrogenase family protein [Jidongwangia harbinensis]|uniref:acyl-CoA dehydrogenase family protein n=1 Tax=Jidongwangia harbinensis TaxID=2878561 RepID=UPI001CD9EE4A|nr:acyl-CoA dehydrogenase family protein [Jidongwangia harbinensis]MCA2213352.1 acyl-CoA dehydrogenase family protein [Jidongwangia harbinensis]